MMKSLARVAVGTPAIATLTGCTAAPEPVDPNLAACEEFGAIADKYAYLSDLTGSNTYIGDDGFRQLLSEYSDLADDFKAVQAHGELAEQQADVVDALRGVVTGGRVALATGDVDDALSASTAAAIATGRLGTTCDAIAAAG